MDGKRMRECGVKYIVVKVNDNTHLTTIFGAMDWDGPTIDELNPLMYITADEALMLNENCNKVQGIIKTLDSVYEEEKGKCRL